MKVCPWGGECPDCLEPPAGGWPQDPAGVIEILTRRIGVVIDPAQPGSQVRTDVQKYLRAAKNAISAAT